LLAAFVCALPVGAIAAPTCRITVAPDFGFGLYDLNNGTTTQRTVTIDCPGKFQNPLLIIEGAAADGSRNLVHQTNSTEQLRYFLWLGPITLIDDRNGYEVVVHGRIDPGQDVAAGTYADLVTLTFQL
jgi:spore coat protein U-like protein